MRLGSDEDRASGEGGHGESKEERKNECTKQRKGKSKRKRKNRREKGGERTTRYERSRKQASK